MSLAVIRLSSLLEKKDEMSVSAYLSIFKCSKDEDLEKFLHGKAIEFEKKSRSRTYLVINTDENNRIIAYVSLAITRIIIPNDNELSNKVVKRMDVSEGSAIAYLIGQLAKDDCVKKKFGHTLMQLSLDLLRVSNLQVGCRTICIDCKEKLIKFYKEEGFKIINPESNGENGLYRMVMLF